jgi:1,4-alpha-glucan branching enzyme
MRSIKYLFVALLLSCVSIVKAQPTAASSTNKVLTAYLGIKNALVADNSKLANAKAKEFTEALKEVAPAQLDDKQKTTWTSYSEKLRFDGEHISESDKIAHQREHFTSLSKNMIAVVKALKLNSSVVYEEYCPMKKASWLSETAAIRNPYYGKQMEDCGSVKETYKAN